MSRSGKPVAEVSHPGHNVPFDFDLTGVLKGVRQDGGIAVAAWAEAATKDSAVKAVSFLLEGDIHNPRFSLNEAFATRMASVMAESLGVSIQGVAEATGMLGRQGVEAFGQAGKVLGGAIGGLFGGQQKK